MKRLIALTLLGTMIFSVPVMAKDYEPPVAVYLESSSNVGDPSITVAAIEEDKLVGEYMNNAVTGTWLLENVIPVAQGGDVIVDGVQTDLTFVLKADADHSGAAIKFAENMGGKVLNVVTVKNPVTLGFSVANVNFYTPGITDGQNVKVYKYNKGEWVEFNVTEVREDHVVVDMTSGGVIAFIEVAQ